METNHLKSHTEQSQALDDWSARGYPNTNDHFTHPKSPADKSFDISATSKALLSEDDRSRKPSFSRSPQPKASNIFMPLVDWQAEVVSENIALAGIVRTPKIPQEFNIPTTKVTRAQWNWNKLKRIYHALKVEGTLKLFIAEKERKVHRGTTIKELVVYQSYWARFKLFYIDPRTRSMTIWRFIFEVGVVYYTLVFPCQLAFGTNRTQLDPLNVITDIVDVHFFTDMIMTFFVALRQPDGTLITHKSTIVKSYLKGLFFIDLIGILPYELFLPHLSFLKLLRIIHLGRFFGHMNQFADLIVPYFVQGLAIIKIADFIGSLITSLLVLGLTFHYLACMWVLLGKKESANEMTWFDDITFKYELDGETIVDGKTSIYTSSLEHIAQTLTTVGYGTFYGFTARELLFSIFVLLFGIIVFTFVFEKTKSILASYNEADRRQKLQIKKLDAWLRKLDWAVIDYKDMVNEPLLEKIKTILTYRIDESWQKLFTNNEQFKKLDNESGRMILDLAMNKFKKKFDIIFRDISSEFVYKILAQSDSRLFMPGEVIISRGKRPKGLFLILRGSILLAGPSEEKYFTRLGSNSFFGEICIASERRSPIYYIAESEVNCLFIRKEIIEELRGKFPIDIQKLKALAFFRYKHFLYQKHHHQQQEINGSPKRTNNEDISDSSLQVLQTYDVDKQIDLISPPEPYSVDQNTEIHLLASPEINEKDQVFKDFDTNKSPEKNLQRHKTEDPGLIPLLKPSRKKNKKKTTIISKAVDKLLTLDESDIELAQNSSESELGDYFDAESEESQQDINQEEIRDYENEKEEDDPDHLNSSEIYPLEVNSVFSDILKSDNYLEYLEERVVFIQDRLKKLNQKFNLELQYTLRRQQAINRKLIVAGMAGGPFALIKR